MCRGLKERESEKVGRGGGRRKRGRKEEKRRGEKVRKDGESDWNMEKMDREQVRGYGEQEELDRDWGNDSRERLNLTYGVSICMIQDNYQT